MSPTDDGQYRGGVLQRFALATAIAAVVAALAMVSMHAVDAHPTTSGLPGHADLAHATTPAPPPVAVAHDTDDAADVHGGHAGHHQSATTVSGATAADAQSVAGGAAPGEQGHRGHGHSDGFAHHIAMCAAIVLAGFVAAFYLGRRSRVTAAAVQRLIGTPLRIDPPVPRLVLAPI